MERESPVRSGRDLADRAAAGPEPADSFRPEPHHAARLSWLVIAILLLGVFLRLTGLTVHSLWIDEGDTVATARAHRPLEAIEQTRHPPVSFLTFRIWIQVFGESDASLRWLPALLSCVSLLLFARLARLWLGDPGRLVALTLYAVSAFHIWHGQEARGYAFLEIGTLIALSGAAQMLRQGTISVVHLALVFLGTALALGSHYMGVLVAVSITALALAAWRLGRLRRGHALSLVAAATAGMAAWIPWLVIVVPRQMATPFGYQAHLDLGSLFELPVRHLLTNLEALSGPARPAVYALGAALLLGFVLHLARWGAAFLRHAPDRFEATWIVVAFFAPLAGAWLLALFYPANFTPKYLMVAAPGSVLMIGSGLGWIARNRTARVAVAAVCLGVLALTVYLRTGNHREDFRSACREIESQLAGRGSPARCNGHARSVQRGHGSPLPP